ncbi:broad-complex core protein-like isoform X1 [Planococcus citri]|uniref:broad-complex core protein-like isoform X1 n=1 Tax=Planococcus citri TaxID=170843 RepID=UPI0031F732C6
MADHFCLRWNNYQSNMVSELDSLRSDKDLVDVTLSCEGHLLKAHKVILSACSSYFRNVFKDNPCKHPVVILKDVNHEDVEALLNFVYQGVVYISEKKLASFLQTAELLQIRGLTGAATIKETAFEDSATNQNKLNDKTSVPPPPQLLTANVINSWKQNASQTSCSSSKSSQSNPPSPSLPSVKRKKSNPSRIPQKENLDSTDTNSNQDCSEAESDTAPLKRETVEDAEMSEDYKYLEDISKEESSRDNSAFYDNLESDETEEENGDPSKPKLSNMNADKLLGLSNSTNSNFMNMMANYPSSQSTSDQNSSLSETRLGRRPCPLCQKIISNKSNLLKHMRIRHSDEYNPAGCNLCGKVFKNKYSLRAHVNIYHKETNTSNNYPFSSYPQTSSSECGHSLSNNNSSLCPSNSPPVSVFSSTLMNSNYVLPSANDINPLTLM